jgi:hypothetical protein
MCGEQLRVEPDGLGASDIDERCLRIDYRVSIRIAKTISTSPALPALNWRWWSACAIAG